MALVDASRRWRRGVRTYIVADKVLPFQLRVRSLRLAGMCSADTLKRLWSEQRFP